MIGFNVADLSPEELQRLSVIHKKKAKLLEEIQLIKEEMEQIDAQMDTLDIEDDDIGTKTKQAIIGRKKFNNHPKKGLEYLFEYNIIDKTSEAVAEFLFNGEGLSKTAIGQYLGERDDFNLEVLDKFVKLHDFTNKELVDSLRQFLGSFMLPGESQKIDRMMQLFAQRYCDQNPGVFNHADVCYVLSFSVIMLNTNLYNPNVKEKLTAEKFINMCRGANEGADLPREFLLSLYNNIKNEEFKMPTDEKDDLMNTFINPDKKGFLWKKGSYKTWKKRWFILSGKCLYYFENQGETDPRGIIPLENVKVRFVEEKNKQHVFEIFSSTSEVIKACKTETDGRVVEGKHTTYRMCAPTAEDMHQWINAIQRSINNDPFFDMLQLRKKRIETQISETSLNSSKDSK
ncbi:MIP16918p [Strongyloides ratti]|uniref:MIP16918p n=1 Tax=Strongyloides ratti TaxID=34506 RepID=A0A090LEW5_STRRB|nr:MIP16918p [Strongyloides ratti]CEF68287.1 MIP16918p [Strongyloides ratti]